MSIELFCACEEEGDQDLVWIAQPSTAVGERISSQRSPEKRGLGITNASKPHGRWVTAVKAFKIARRGGCFPCGMAVGRAVAQTCSLLYRRFVTCGSPAESRVLGLSGALPITNRRYGRLKICATVNRYRALPDHLNEWSTGSWKHAAQAVACASASFSRARAAHCSATGRTSTSIP